MGYDVQFIRVPLPRKVSFPVQEEQARALLKGRKTFTDLEAVRDLASRLAGCRPGPGQTLDYLGTGLNYARLSFGREAVHVENNCGARELLKIFRHLAGTYPDLLILDVQSNQLHSAESFEQWWSRPL